MFLDVRKSLYILRNLTLARKISQNVHHRTIRRIVAFSVESFLSQPRRDRPFDKSTGQRLGASQTNETNFVTEPNSFNGSPSLLCRLPFRYPSTPFSFPPLHQKQSARRNDRKSKAA